MLPVSFARQSVQRLAAVTETDHGNTVRSWPATGPVKNGLLIEPVNSREENLDRDATITQYRVQAPESSGFSDDDHLLYRGKTYQIVGEVQFQPSPSGLLDHLVFTMEVWTG